MISVKKPNGTQCPLFKPGHDLQKEKELIKTPIKDAYQ